MSYYKEDKGMCLGCGELFKFKKLKDSLCSKCKKKQNEHKRDNFDNRDYDELNWSFK